MVTPSEEFATNPFSPSSEASPNTKGLNPTPCTVPVTLMNRRSFPTPLFLSYYNFSLRKNERKAIRPRGRVTLDFPPSMQYGVLVSAVRFRRTT
jgi:hypothetical protein